MRNTFKLFVLFLKEADLVSGKLVAIDGSKVRAHKYHTPACKTCPVKHSFTGRAQGGRELDRSEFAQAVQENNQRNK